MPFTVEEFRDLVRILEARPEWREEIRRLVLTDALLTLPEQMAELRARSEQQFQTLAEAQQRTEGQVAVLADRVTALADRVTALAEAQQHTEGQVAVLTDRVTALAEEQRRTEGQIEMLVQAMQTLTDDVGELKGKSLETDYRTKGHAYFSRLVRRPHVLTSDELTTLVEDARDRGVLLSFDAQEIYDADVVARGRRLEDGTEVYLLVEVSWGVGRNDVEWAAQRAALLARLGTPVIPVVAGKRITPAVARLAHKHQVWQLTNGRATPPEAASAPT
jgi:hypothetical protein